MRGEVKWEIVSWLRSKWLWATKFRKNYVVSKIYIRFLISWLMLPFYQIFSTFGLFVKLIKNYYSIFFFTICFCLHLCYPFITGKYIVFQKYNNIFFIIHAIFWDHDTSRSVVFYEIIFWRHRSRFIVYMLNKRRKRKKTEKNTQDTFF